MTIRSKKKVSKDKPEAENGEMSPHSPGYGVPEQRVGSHVPNMVTLSTATPPPMWNQREERHPAHHTSTHETAARFKEYEPREGTSGHNKRRHRTSPHRNARKHRHTSHTHGRGGQSAPSTSHRPQSQYLDILPGGIPATPSPTEEIPASPERLNSDDEYSPHPVPENWEEVERLFEASLKEKRGLIVRQTANDGACLFRAVAIQLYGDEEMHSIVRQNCLDFMAKNADFYSQYVTEDWNSYMRRKRNERCHGNHIEIQAMSELYNRPFEVYQYSTEPINTFNSVYKTDNEPIRLSYHQNTHYNAMVDPYKATVGVGLGLPGYQPGLAEKNLMSSAINMSETAHIEQTMFEDKVRETDWEVTQETINEQVARESYLQWLKDQQKQNSSSSTMSRTASASCSSAASGSQPAWWETTPSPKPRSPEHRPNRSPRNSNSNQSSPNRTDPVLGTSPHPAGMNTAVPGVSYQCSPKMSDVVEGAVGGAPAFQETTSIMNELPPQLFGLSEWDEDDVMAQVIAQSQSEYLDSLKNKNTTEKPDTQAKTDS